MDIFALVRRLQSRKICGLPPDLLPSKLQPSLSNDQTNPVG